MLRSGLVIASLIGLAGPAAASDTRLSASYTTSLLGFTVSRAQLELSIAGRSYDLRLDATASGLARIFTAFQGTARARGALGPDRALPQSFAVQVEAGEDRYDVDMGFRGRNVVSRQATPPHDPHPSLVPLDGQAGVDVIDPLSAFLIPYRMRGDGRTLCDRRVPIFTGRERFDLHLTYERHERVEVEGAGPMQAVVCTARFVPIQGYRADRDAIVFMRENRDLRAWFIPVQGHDLMALFRARVGTRIGAVVVELDRVELRAGGTRRAEAPGEPAAD